MKIEDFMLSCPSKKYLGIECLGCGAQRALALIFRGKFADAFIMYPAIYSLLLFLFFVVLHYFDKKRNYKRILSYLAWINVIIIISSYAYKHI